MATLSELLEKRKSRENEANNSSSNEGENYYSLSDLLEKRRTRKAYEAGRLGVMMSPMLDRVSKWRENAGKYYTDYATRYDVKEGSYVYRGDTEDYLNGVTVGRDDLNREAESIRRELEFYKPYVSEEYYNYLIGALDGSIKGDDGSVITFDTVVDNATRDHDFYSQFEDEAAYKGAYYNHKFATKYSDIDSYEAALNALNIFDKQFAENQRRWEFEGRDVPEEYTAEKEYLVKLLGYYNTKYYDADGEIAADLQSAWDNFYENEYVDGAGADNDEIEALDRSQATEADLTKRQKDHEDKVALRDKLLKHEEYESYRQNEDFAERSKYVSDNEDLMYEYINGNQNVIKALSENPEAFVEHFFGVDKSFLKSMTDNEVSMYNYLYSLDKEDEGTRADEYLDFLKLDLKGRHATEMFEAYLKDQTILEILLSVPAGLAQFASGISGIFKDEYDPSIVSLMGQMAREDLADDGLIPYYDFVDGSWHTMTVLGSSGAQVLYDIGSTTANMLPSILLSAAIELSLPTVGEGGVVFAGLTGAKIAAGAGALTMGASAMGNAKQEMLSMGYSVDQATAYGLMVGASEAGLSYLLGGIPGLRGGDGVFSALGQKAITKVDNALAKAAIALGGNMLDEGLEEGLQTVLENWFKEIATGVDFEDPSAEEILYSSLLGALTAAGFGGGKLAIGGTVGGVKNYIKYNKTGKSYANMGGQNGIGALAAQGLGLNQDTAAYKQAQKIQAKLDAGKSASNYSVGKLLSSMSESQTVTAVQTRLSAHIENKNDVRKLSNTITDILFGREVSDSALSGVAANKYALNTLNDVLGAKLKSGATVSDVKAAVKSYQTLTTSKSGANASTNAKQGSEVKISGRGGATFSVQENADGRFDVIAEASGNSGSIASYETRNQAQAAAYGYTLGMGAEGLSGFVYISEGIADGADLGEVAIAYNAIYNQGKQGKALSAVKNMELLSPEQRQYAYNLGIMDRALDSARAKNAAAEISKENDGKVLQNDGVGDKIEESNDAIWRYKSSESYKINEAVRSGRELTEEESAFIEELDRELEKTPKYSGVVYRNMSFDLQGKEALDEFVAQHAEGSIITYDAYTSTSKIKDGYVVDGELLVHIEIDGENGNDVSRGYGLEEEQEVLYGRKTRFVVTSVSYDGKTANIVMEEFTNGERAIQRGIEGDKSTQQRYDSESNSSEMQRLQKTLPEESDDNLQDVYQRNPRRNIGQRDNLQGVREEVISDSNVQQAKSDQASSSEWDAERIKDGKVEKAKPISEIIERIRHDFGINITKGHVRGKGVLGQYSRKNHGIRTKIANDLPTVAHELGHALDQRYSLTDKSKLTKEMRSELINALGDLKDSYKQNLWVSEGFAEYLRRFLQNRDEAARSYPEFTKHFLNSLSKADRVLMDTFADEINAYYALDADTATSSIRLREEGTPDARTALEKAKEMGDGVYQAWVDANHGIRLFDEATDGDTYKLAANAAYSDAIAGQIITGDLTDANGQYVAPGLKSALEGVNIGDKRIYREFGEYLVLRHGPERLNEGMMIFADPRKNTASFMAERQAKLEAAHPEFKEAADRLYEFQKQFLRTWAVDTGLLPAEVAEAWGKRWSFYVPLNRAVGKAGRIGAKRGYANQNSTVKKAIGSGLDIVHPVDNIINNIVKMVNAGVRNNVMLQLTAQAETLGADAMFMEKVPTPMKKKTADLTGVKAKLHDAFGAAGISELLAEVEREQDVQARKSVQASRFSFQNTKSGMAHEKLSAYDEDLSNIIKDRGDIIIDSYEKLREVVDLAFNQPNKKATAFLGSISPETLRDIVNNIPNLPLEYKESLFKGGRNYSIAMTMDSIRHIVDDKNLTQADVLNYLDKLPETVLSFDSVAFDFYTDSFGKKTPGLLFKKKFPNGTLVSFNLVSNKKRSLSLQTLYLNRADYENKRSAETLLMQNASAHTLKAGVGQTSSNNSIPQEKENVNKKFSTNSSEGKNGAKSEVWSKVDEIIESTIDDVLIQYGQGKAHGDVVTVLRNGKQEFWKINDALLLESLTNMSQKKMNGIMEAYAVVSRFMTSNITGNNIVWSIFSNFPRDLMTFFTYSKQKNPLKAFPAMGEAYLNKVTGGNADTKNLPYIKEYYALGGGQTSAYTADVDLAKRARKKIKNSTKLQNAAYYANPLNTLSFISETVESGPRIATYIMMREQGMSPQEAFYESQDITVNFKRGGRLSREFNKAVPFFNASVQGLDKFRRWITCADVPKATRAKAIVGRVTVYVAVSAALGALFYALNNWDDEDEENYRLLSNYTKNTYWCIPLGDGKYFAIPKPREIAVLSTFFESTCEYFGGNDYAYDGFGEYVADNFLPPFVSDFVTDGLDGALGSLGMIGVVSDLRANKDFLGRPIESTSLQGYEPKDRYTRRTSMIAYWLGQAAAELGLDWSPVQIDYFFGQTLGGYWKVQKALFPVGSENVDLTLGVQNTYVKDNQYSNDIVNWLYDEAGASAMAKNSNPDDMDIAIDAKLDDNMKAFYSRYYALTKGQKEDSASRRAKRAVLDMIIEYRKATDNGDRSAAEKAVYDIVASCGDTSLLPAVMQSTVKDSNKNEIKLTDIQYVEYQTVYNDLYWSFVVENLDAAKSEAEKIAILKQAQSVAKQRATDAALKSAGARSSGYFDEYSGIEDKDLVTFKTQLDLSDDEDGGTSQEEVIAIIEQMVKDGLSKEDAYTLFHSCWDSDKNNPWRRYAP